MSRYDILRKKIFGRTTSEEKINVRSLTDESKSGPRGKDSIAREQFAMKQLNDLGLDQKIDLESHSGKSFFLMPRSRREMLKWGVVGGSLIGAGMLGGGIIDRAMADPGSGIPGTVISSTDLDAKRIGGTRFITEFDTIKHAGTHADPFTFTALSNAYADAGINPIFLPAVYLISGSYQILNATSPFRLFGIGPNQSRTEKIQLNIQPSDAFLTRSTIQIQDMGFSTTDTTVPVGKTAIYIAKAWSPLIYHCGFNYWDNAIEIEALAGQYAYQSQIFKSMFFTNRASLWLKANGANYANDLRAIDNDCTIDSGNTLYQNGSTFINVDPIADGVDVEKNQFFGLEKIIQIAGDQNTHHYVNGNHIENCINLYSSKTTAFYRVFSDILGNTGITVPIAGFHVLNYIYYSGKIQSILGAANGSNFSPNNAESEWTTAWCKIPNTTVLGAGDNLFTFVSSSRMLPIRYGGAHVVVRDRANVVVPYTIYARDNRDATPGTLVVHLILTAGLTLSSDFNFYLEWIFP